MSVLFIISSIFSFCLKTHPDMRVPHLQNRTVHSSLPNGTLIDKWVSIIVLNYFDCFKMFQIIMNFLKK